MSQPSSPGRGTTEPPDGEAEGGARPRLEAVLAHAPVMVFELDPEGRYTSCGGRPMGEIGLDPAAMLGRSILAVFAGYPEVQEAARRALAGETVRQLARLAGGRSFELICNPGVDGEGRVRRVIGVAYDVTESLRAADARAEEQARLKDFAEATSDWFWETDDRHRFAWFSDRFEAATGLRPAAVLGTTRTARSSGDPGDDDWARHVADLEAHRPFRDFTFAFDDDAGRRRIAQVSGVPFFDAAGTFRGYRGSGRDVTQERAARGRLRESEQRFRSLVHNLRGIHFCRATIARGGGPQDAAGEEVTVYGRGAPVAATAAAGDDGQGRPDAWRARMLPEDRARHAALEARRRRHHLPYEIDFRVAAPPDGGGGGPRWMREVAWVTEDPGSATVHLDSYVLDVTDQKRREEALADARSRLEAQNEELREARRAAEAASRAKSDFLAVMSHEIRTPMTAVLGMADLLAAAALPERERRHVEAIRTSSRHLLSVINDILDFSRIESGRLELERIDFSVPEILEQARSLMMPRAVERGLDLRLGVDGPPPPIVRGDPTRMLQVLLNLVGNALKFTHAGGVSVRVAHRPAGPGRVAVRFEVLDTGVGIAPERQRSVFQAFTQADSSTNRTYGGSGLGLAISARLVAAMGGAIGLESEPGRGSLFWFEAPLEVGDAVVAAGRAALDPASVPPLRILLAEDVDLNRELVCEMLGRYGHEVALAEDGREAVARAAAERFDMVLMDVQMPVMDGVEATRRIRRLPPPAGDVPIVALTANVIASERERYRAAGMDACVTKPIAWPDLFAAMAGVAAGRTGGAGGGPLPGSPFPERPPTAAPGAEETGQPPLIDAAVLASLRAGLPPEAVADLLGRAVEAAALSCARLPPAPGEGGEAAAEMHRLRGTSGSFGLARISALAGRVEAALERGADVTGLASRLEAAVAATRRELLGGPADPSPRGTGREAMAAPAAVAAAAVPAAAEGWVAA